MSPVRTPLLIGATDYQMGGMDVFLLSSGIGKQNLSLQPDIELQTAATNVSIHTDGQCRLSLF